jgi:hypothetical protein
MDGHLKSPAPIRCFTSSSSSVAVFFCLPTLSSIQFDEINHLLIARPIGKGRPVSFEPGYFAWKRISGPQF